MPGMNENINVRLPHGCRAMFGNLSIVVQAPASLETRVVPTIT